MHFVEKRVRHRLICSSLIKHVPGEIVTPVTLDCSDPSCLAEDFVTPTACESGLQVMEVFGQPIVTMKISQLGHCIPSARGIIITSVPIIAVCYTLGDDKH